MFAAPGLRMQYASSLVFKQYKPDVARALDAAVLESMPAYLESLPFAQGMELLSQAAWPCRLVDDRGAVAGFVMPAIPDAFFVQMRKSSGMSREAAEMQHLLNDDSFLARRQLAVSDRRRYELLGETARALSVFHRHGIAVGDLSPKNLLYARQAPGVYFIDCDAMRFRGRSVMPQLETPGWEVRAVSPREELGTAASDSYKLGLLALRLLAGSQDARDPARLPRAVPAAVRRLVEAALSPDPARRPAPGQWITPLNTAAATASAAAPQAPPRAAPVTTTVAPGFVPGGLAYPRTGQPATGQWPAGTAPSPAPYRPVTRRRGRFTAKTIAWTSGIAAVLIAAIAIVANNGTSLLRPSATVGDSCLVGTWQDGSGNTSSTFDGVKVTMHGGGGDIDHISSNGNDQDAWGSGVKPFYGTYRGHTLKQIMRGENVTTISASPRNHTVSVKQDGWSSGSTNTFYYEGKTYNGYFGPTGQVYSYTYQCNSKTLVWETSGRAVDTETRISRTP